MSRNAAEWDARPKFPGTHYVDARLYTDEGIFREEQEKIFKRTWFIACHESEIPRAHDYRTFRHPSGTGLVVARGDDGEVRAFYNVCPHRGNTLVQDPAGNARVFICIFHSWTFDCRGTCTGISRPQGGVQDRLDARDVGLRNVRVAVGYGGFVWVNLDDNAMTLDDFIGGALGTLEPHLREPLEVFHYQKVIVRANYKLWHDTNSEFYHDYMHHFNRVTGMLQPGYFDRKYLPFPNGHAAVGSMEVQYDRYEGGTARAVGWPGSRWVDPDRSLPGDDLQPANLGDPHRHVDPHRAKRSHDRAARAGASGDTPEERAARVRDHNAIWGPFGRNLHEDLLGVRGQGLAMRDDRAGARWILHAREENQTIHDEIGMRHFYAE